jgi:hypothetical protein
LAAGQARGFVRFVRSPGACCAAGVSPVTRGSCAFFRLSSHIRVFFIFFFNFLVKKFYFQSTLSRVFKPSTRVKPVSRAGSSAVSSVLRGLEPRAPELEILRLFGAGVGAGSLNLAFELNICPECGWRLIEHNGLLVCKRSRYTPEAGESKAAARRLRARQGAPRHAVTPLAQSSSTPAPRGARSSLLPKREPGPPEARFQGGPSAMLGADGPGAPPGDRVWR